LEVFPDIKKEVQRNALKRKLILTLRLYLSEVRGRNPYQITTMVDGDGQKVDKRVQSF